MRGNHESKNMNRIYGFEGEVKAKVRRPDAQGLAPCILRLCSTVRFVESLSTQAAQLLMPFLFPVDPLAPRSTTTW